MPNRAQPDPRTTQNFVTYFDEASAQYPRRATILVVEPASPVVGPPESAEISKKESNSTPT